jgi:membrane protein DedA with SNARE-associated domain
MFDWIVDVVRTLGYPGIAFLTLLENVIPPIPSELIMPLAGFNAERGALSFVGAVAAGSLGSLLGAIGWYVVGRRVGGDSLRRFFHRHGRWLALDDDDLQRATSWFERHGGIAVLVGRLVPGLRTFISVPAGITDMGAVSFTAYTAVGTVLWTAALTGAGVLLGRNYDAVQDYVGPATWLVLAAMLALYAYKVVTYDGSDGGRSGGLAGGDGGSAAGESAG